MANPYLDLVPDAAPAGAPKANPYLRMIEDDDAARQQALAASLRQALPVNPDKAAGAVRLSRETGIPAPVVERNEDEISLQSRIADIRRAAAASPILARQLTDPAFAKLAHDDVGSLSSLEALGSALTTAAKYVVSAPDSYRGGAAGLVGRGVETGILQTRKASAGLGQALLAPLDNLQRATGILPGNPFAAGREMFRQGGEQADAELKAMQPPDTGIVERGATSGVASMTQQAKYAPLLAFGPVGGTVALTMMALETAGGAFSDAKAKGLSDTQSLVFAGLQGGIEAATEKIPMDRLVGDLAKNAGLFKTLLHQVKAELPGEQAATFLQDLNEWATLNPGKTVKEFMAERPAAALETLIATVVAVGGNTSLSYALDRTINSEAARTERARTALQGAQGLEKALQVAAQSALRQRDPESFAAFLQNAAPDAEVFVPAREVAQVLQGVPPEQVPPSIRAQLDEALATGGDVRIPVAEYLTTVPGTPLEQGLQPYIRLDQDGLSQAEADAVLSRGAQDAQGAADRAVAEHEGRQMLRDSQAKVEQMVREQLDATGRFTSDANEAYAKLLGAFYTVQAARLGTTPEALAQRYGLQFQAGAADGATVMEQGGALADVLKGWDAVGVEHTVSESGGTISVGKIVVPKDAREQGKGTAAMRELLAYADRTGQRVVLSPSADFGGAKGRLFKFYKGLGFKENKGRSRDFTTRETMIREPQGGSAFNQSDADRAPGFADAVAAMLAGTRTAPASLGAPAPTLRAAGLPDLPIAITLDVVRKITGGKHHLTPQQVQDLPRLLAEPLMVFRSATVEGSFVVVLNAEAPTERGTVEPIVAALNPQGRVGRQQAIVVTSVYGKEGFGGAAANWTDKGLLVGAQKKTAAGWLTSRGLQLPKLVQAIRRSGTVNLDPESPAVKGAATGGRFGQGPRGQIAFGTDITQVPSVISLFKGADLSTVLHESGHFFLQVMFDMAERGDAPAEVVADAQALLDWFGVTDLRTWFSMSPEEQRQYHEKFARGFEARLFEGDAPSPELAGIFARFRAWLLRIYQDIKALNVELTPEVRAVMDRMVATNDEILAAEQARSMMPMWEQPDQPGGPTTDEWMDYNDLAAQSVQEAAATLERRTLRELRLLAGARDRILKKLQKEAEGLRREERIEARRIVMSEPVYRAWQFLTGRVAPEDRIVETTRKSVAGPVDPSIDSLFVAIAKNGGLRRDDIESRWGFDPKERSPQPLFGTPVLRREGGLSVDDMVEKLVDQGYLSADESGRGDARDLEDRFSDELRGAPQYSSAFDYEGNRETRAGDTVDATALRNGKLSLGELRLMDLPAELIALLESRKMTAKGGGLHPDIVAELFGFTSGDELVRAIVDAQPPKDAIEAETDRLMLERHGELATPDALEKAADQAIHNQARERMVAAEAAALEMANKVTARNERGAMVRVLQREAKMIAQAVIGRVRIRDIRPGQYATAAARAGRLADAARGKDLKVAAAEKRNQLLQTTLARLAYTAQDDVKAAIKYLRKFDSKGVRDALDAGYLQQIDALLAKFDLSSKPNAEQDRTASLRTWVQSRLNDGEIPDISESLLTAQERQAYLAEVQSRDEQGNLVYADDEERIKLLADAIDRSARRPYRDLTVEEFQGLVDTVKHIEHLGRLKDRLLTAKADATYKAVRDEIAGSIVANATASGKNERTATDWLGKKLQAVRLFGARHIKAASWARVMDGGQDDGPVWRYLIQPANERAAWETEQRAQATARLSEILKPILDRVSVPDLAGKGRYFPTLRESLNWGERFAVLLNTGNESNLQRLLDGRGWTMQAIQPVLQSFTAAELQAAQAVWDTFESFRPQIAEKERRVNGKEPQWIEPRPITIASKDGGAVTLRGGYFPVVYDRRVNQIAEQHAAAEQGKEMARAARSAATTRRSFTKARVDEVHDRPVLLSMQGLYSGLNDVIHDLAWHEWVIDANKLMRSQAIDEAIREHYGPEVKSVLNSWRDDIVVGTRPLDSAAAQFAGFVRQSVSASALTFNVLSAAMQPLGLANSIARVGATWVGKGFARWVGSPIGSVREAQEMSTWMRNRSRTRFRELNELRNAVEGQTRAKELMGRYGYWLMMRTQLMVDGITWWAGYEKAIAEGRDEDTAIALADQGVKDSQGGGEEVDQAGVERGNTVEKLFTVFYSFMGSTLNTAFITAKTEKSKAKAAANLALVLMVPAVAGAIIKDALIPGGDDDDEKLAAKLIAEQIGFLFGLLVGAREVSQLAQIVAGTSPTADYTGPAGLRPLGHLFKAGQQAAQGEFDLAFAKSFVSLLGDLTGLPSGQINRTLSGGAALAEGETENPAALVFGYQRQ